MPNDARLIPLLVLLASGLSGTFVAAEDAPLSAIDWLSSSVAAPAGAAIGRAVAPARPDEPPVTPGGALPQDVAVSRLDVPSPDGLGLLAPGATGLPRALWGMGLEREIIAAIATSRADLLPAQQALTVTLMLAETAPPVDSKAEGRLLIARIDRLLAMGALDQARALLEKAPADSPEIFRRAFDVALLTGNEDRGCERMRETPNLAPTFPARIFCLARSGDWNAAALTLRTAQALGHVSEEDDALLSRFLDPDLYEGDALPPVPQRMTPLSWRMFEAIGEPVSTASLPLAFSNAELRDTAGWRSQIEAAERLARAGALPPEALLALYSDRVPAASGGVWDRVEAVQRLDAALRAGRSEDVARRLPELWAQMSAAELEVPFARLFAAQLARQNLTGEAGRIAFEITLLAPRYEAAARARMPQTPREAFLIGLATGDLKGRTPPDSLGRAIAPAFLGTPLSETFARLLDEGRTGEAILLAQERIGRGVQGEIAGVTEGLAVLRRVGLEDAARRTALELMLLERRG